MKVLFVHDHPFYQNGQTFYSGGGLPSSIWSRYLKAFTSIKVVGRGKKWERNLVGLTESSRENVSFDLIFEVEGGIDYFTKSSLIKKHLKRAIEECDAVIVRVPSALGNYCAQLCIKMNKPYIAEVVGNAWDSNWNYGNIIGKLLAPYSHFSTKKSVRHSAASIYVTKSFLQKCYPNPGKLTSYASNVRIEEFPNEVLENHVSLLRKEKNTFQLGLIGNLKIKYKGFDTAIRALKLVMDRNNLDLNLNLIGGGTADDILNLTKKYGVEQNVKILGLLESGEAIYDALDELDLYIHPSRVEGLPRAVIEAMGRACPVLASNVGGIPELLDQKYLHNPEDYKSMALHIENSLLDSDELVRMSRNNFCKAKEYTNQVLAKRRDEFWTEAAKLF